jgi:hypothetical protein
MTAIIPHARNSVSCHYLSHCACTHHSFPFSQTMSRNEKKDIKRRTADASRLDNFNDIGDIGEFEELAELSKSINKGKKGVPNGFAEEGKATDTDWQLSIVCAVILLTRVISYHQSKRRVKEKHPWTVATLPKPCREQ